jgi:hypothetical protein
MISMYKIVMQYVKQEREMWGTFQNMINLVKGKLIKFCCLNKIIPTKEKPKKYPQSYWVFGLFPSYGVLGSRNKTFRKLNLFPSSADAGSRHLFSWAPQIETMEKVQKPSNSVCYTPSSEPYKIYRKIQPIYNELYPLHHNKWMFS